MFGKRRLMALEAIAATTAMAAMGCASPEDSAAERPRAGGDTTVFDRSSNAYSFPAPNLADDDLDRHLEGDVEFEATFVTSPSPVNPGLGPQFNNTACTKCHVRDGRGLPVAGSGPLGSALVVQLSAPEARPEVPGGPAPVASLGTQLRDHAVFGVEPDGAVRVDWVETSGEYADGEPFSLRRPNVQVSLRDGQPLSRDVETSARIPSPVFGLGLLEAVPEAEVLALADPEDRDEDGLSGRANRVWDAERGETALGRFGWKASTPTLRLQAALDYERSLGVSSPLRPEPDGTAELDEARLAAVAFYTATLAVPGRFGAEDAAVERGEALFRTFGCAKCHVEELTTGEAGVSALSHQTFHAYTDLLLHNMGFDLADGRPDFEASGTEWRTAPLWGIGLAETVLPTARFLHDGRARSLAEAILWHGGEAESSRESFRRARGSERDALIAFLRSL